MEEEYDVNRPEEAITNEMVIEEFRIIRNGLLIESDKFMISDYPITGEKREEWKVYRQSLRELPSTIDLTQLKMNSRFELINFTWPQKPS
mgnify:CR=1 FL=1|tara:strand:- start:195 stop:464 length:270 start_codon:yes stop_codon:yes gene_type:complete